MGRLTLRGAFILGGLVIAAYWVSNVAVARATDSYVALRRSTPPAYLINGYVPNLGALATTTSGSPLPSASRRCRLVLVVSDSCKGCEGEISKWTELLVSDREDWRAHVAIVTVDGRRLASLLESVAQKAGRSYDVSAVSDKASFVVQTGLVATPMTVVLDETGAARTVSRNLSDESHREILSRLRQCS